MTSTVTFHVGDVRDAMAAMPDASVDLIVTSPPFLALRSYLPADHPDKAREIGSEPTPATYLDTLLELTAEWRRLLTPTGSLCVELGDTYSGSGGAGGDYGENGLREGQPTFKANPGRSVRHQADGYTRGIPARAKQDELPKNGPGWPLPKSLCGIPALYQTALAYGINPLTGLPSPAGQWRCRNQLVWTRPNPPVGALGDKFRPATSYVTVACTSANRWFDLDAVRDNLTDRAAREVAIGGVSAGESYKADASGNGYSERIRRPAEGGGAPPLDWHHDNLAATTDTQGVLDAVRILLADAERELAALKGIDPPDNSWQPLHRLPTAPYPGAHYATYPLALPKKLIEAMCPLQVCVVCGEPRRRITHTDQIGSSPNGDAVAKGRKLESPAHAIRTEARVTTLGWTDCECYHRVDCHTSRNKSGCCTKYRPGHVLDPFAGSGTTLLAAALCGRDATGIDIDSRNRVLALRRLNDDCHVHLLNSTGTSFTWTVNPDLPGTKNEHPDQQSLFG